MNNLSWYKQTKFQNRPVGWRPCICRWRAALLLVLVPRWPVALPPTCSYSTGDLTPLYPSSQTNLNRGRNPGIMKNRYLFVCLLVCLLDLFHSFKNLNVFKKIQIRTKLILIRTATHFLKLKSLFRSRTGTPLWFYRRVQLQYFSAQEPAAVLG